MKTILKTIMAMAAIFTIAGCKELPTVEKITAVSKAVGKTAGYVCELSKTKTEVKEAISEVLSIVSKVVPAEGKTFVEAWTPVINDELQKLVDAGKLDSTGAAVAKLALNVACEGIDYVFIKYPKAKDVQELVSAAVSGFIDGYKSVVAIAANVDANVGIDEEAYKYLKSKMAK